MNSIYSKLLNYINQELLTTGKRGSESMIDRPLLSDFEWPKIVQKFGGNLEKLKQNAQ